MDDREHRIRQRAHEIWETSGRPHGREREHWEQATREVHESGSSAAVSMTLEETSKPGKKAAKALKKQTAASAAATEAETAKAAEKAAKEPKKTKAASSTAAEAAATETETAAAKPRRTAKKTSTRA